MNVFSKFETEMAVRPDDIDLYQHVHSTRYLDYVLAARGLAWFMSAATIQYKRPLGMGDRMVVRCWIERFTETGCSLGFEIDKLPNGKRVCDGRCEYALVTIATGRATPLPDDIRAKYSI